jgi:CheY-like chemotaxis protein
MRPIDLQHKKTEYGAEREVTAMRKTILIADDNAFIRSALYEFFEGEADFHVCAVAENGREAIERARGLNPDLIVLDLAMPLMNGLDAARVLKKMIPKEPLTMYSATIDESCANLAKSAGISEVVSKSDRDRC